MRNEEFLTPKGTSRNKLSNIVGWASCPPYKLGGRDAHPTGVNWIFFYLEVPNSCTDAINRVSTPNS